jgi:hypothetical protein
MNFQDEMNKLRGGIYNDIMRLFERKNSTVTAKSVNFARPHSVIIRDVTGTEMDYVQIYISGISSVGRLILQDGKEISMDDLTIEQLVGLKSKTTEGNLEYRF